MTDYSFKIGTLPISLLGLLKFIIIFLIFYLLAYFLRKFIKKISQKYYQSNESSFYIIGRLGFYFILFIGTLVSFSSLGIDLTALTVFGGAISVGIGFGLQSIFNNFVAGIIILLEKKIRIGDFIQLNEKDLGTVQEINVRTTLITTPDNADILIPNSELVANKFINWTFSNKQRRLRITFSTSLSSDKDQVKNIVINAAKQLPHTMQNKQLDVWLIEIGENALIFELIVWINKCDKNLTYKYLWEIESALRKNNIEIPFPTRNIFTKKES